MIIINNDWDKNTLILEPIPYEYSDVKLVLHSDFNNKDFTIMLEDDIAIHPQRCSQFEIEKSQYSDLETGLYTYTIIADDHIITTGMSRVQTTIPTIVYPTIKSLPEDND